MFSWCFTKRIHCHAVKMQDNANKPCGDIKDDNGGLRGLGGRIILYVVGWQRTRFDVRSLYYYSIFVGNCVLYGVV